MPFYFLHAFKKPTARADAPQISVKHDDKIYYVPYGVHHFITPGIKHINDHLSRAAKAGFQIEFYDEYLQKTQENIQAAQKIRSKLDQTELKKDRGEKVSLNADLPEIKVGMVKYVQQDQLDIRHRLLEPFLEEGIKLQKTKIWRERLLAILDGNEPAKNEAFMQLFCEVWGETPSKLILMDEVAKHFNLKSTHLSVDDVAKNFNNAFSKIKNIPAAPISPTQILYQDHLADYLLTELITKVTELSTNNHKDDAKKLLEQTKNVIPRQLQEVFNQFQEIIDAHTELVSHSGQKENKDELNSKLVAFCDKATCFNRIPAVGEAPIKASVLVYLAHSSNELFNHVIRKKFSDKVPITIQQSQKRLDFSKIHITDITITQITKHFITELGRNIADPAKTAALITESQKTFQEIIDNLILRKAQRRREAGVELEVDISAIDKLIEKTNLAKDALISNQSLSDFLKDEEKIDHTGFGPEKSIILFARYLHKPTDLLEKSKHLVAAKDWCEAALTEVISNDMDQNYKNDAIRNLNAKKAEIIRAQEELAYEMFILIKHICQSKDVNTVNMAQLIFKKAADLSLVNREAFKNVLPRDYPMGENLVTQFIDYIDKNGSLSVRHQLHNLTFPDGKNLITAPTIPLVSHGQLQVPRVIVGEELNIHFTPEGMTPKEHPWFFQINNKARYNLMKNSKFEQFNILMAEINMAMRIASSENGALGEATQYKALQWIEAAKKLLQHERHQLESSWTGGGDFDANYHKVISYAENQLYSTANQLARAISSRLDATFSQQKDFLMSKESLDIYKSFVKTYGKTLLKVNEVGRPIESVSEDDYSKTFTEKTDFLNLFLSRVEKKFYLTSQDQVLAIKKHRNTDIYEIQHDATLCENYHIAKRTDKKHLTEHTKYEINAIRLITAIVTGEPELADFNKDRSDLEKVHILPDDIIKIISKLPEYNKDSAKSLLTIITKRYISTRSLTDLTNSQVQVMRYFDSGMWEKHSSSMVISHRHMLDALELIDETRIQDTINKCNSQEMQDCFLTSHRSDTDQIINDQEKKIALLDREIAPQIIQNATRLLSYQDGLRLTFEQGLKGKEGEKPLPGLTDIIGKIVDLKDIRLIHLERIILNVNPPSNIALSTYRVKLLDLYFSKPDLTRAKKNDMSIDRQKLIDTLPCHFNNEQIEAIRIKIEDPKIVADPTLLILVRDIIKCEKNEAIREELLRRLQFSAIRHYLAIDPIQKNTNQQILHAKKKQLDEILKDINTQRLYTADETREYVELIRLKEKTVYASELLEIKEEGKKTKIAFDTLKSHELNINIGQTLVLDEVSRVNYQATLDTIFEYLPPLAKKAAVHTLSIKLIETGSQLDDAKSSIADGTYKDGNLEFIRKILAQNETGKYFDEKQYETLFNALKVYLTKAEYKIWPLVQLFIEYGGKNLAATYGLNLIQRIILEQVGLRDQAKEGEKTNENIHTQVDQEPKAQPAELLREISLTNKVLNAIANNYFDKDGNELLQNLAKTYAYTRDSYVRNLLIDILKEGDTNRITTELQRNQEDLIRVSKSIKEAIDWIYTNEVTPDTQVKLSTFIGSGISVSGDSKVEYKDRDVMFQGFLNEIAAKFAATQPDAGATSYERKDEFHRIPQDLATLNLLSHTIPFINKLLTQIKRDIPQRFTPQGYQSALAAIPEHDKEAKEKLIADFKKFQAAHHFELNFLRYICRYLNSISHAHIISFMSPEDVKKYVTEIKQIYDKLNEEKQQLVVPTLPAISVKATAAGRERQIEQHKNTIQKFYADQGFLTVMSPSAIETHLKHAVAKQIIQLFAPIEKPENAKSIAEIKKSVTELLPMTDINALSMEFRNLVEKGWFNRPIMEDANWLRTHKGEIFESATAAARFLENVLSQPVNAVTQSNSMIAQAVVDWLYSMSKQAGIAPIDRSLLTEKKQAQLDQFDKFIAEFLPPNIDIKSLSGRELIIKLLSSGPTGYASLYVLINKINDIERVNTPNHKNIPNTEEKLKQVENALRETQNTNTDKVSYARSTALRLYSMMSADDVQLVGKEMFLKDFSDFTKTFLDEDEFVRARHFVIQFNRDDKTRNIAFKNFQAKFDNMLSNHKVENRIYIMYLTAIFSPDPELEKLAEGNNTIAVMLKKHQEMQLDLALHTLGVIIRRLTEKVNTVPQHANEVKDEIRLLLSTYGYLVQSNKEICDASTKVIHDILSKLIIDKMGHIALDVINQFIEDAIRNKRHDVAIEAIYLLGQQVKNNILQLEQKIVLEENNIKKIKSRIELEKNKYQSLVTDEVSDVKYHASVNEFLTSIWMYEDSFLMVDQKESVIAKRAAIQKEAFDAGFNKEVNIFSSIAFKDLTKEQKEKRIELMNAKLFRISSVYRSIHQLLINAYHSAIKDLSLTNSNINLDALARLSVVSFVIEQMPHSPEYLKKIKTECDSLLEKSPVNSELNDSFRKRGRIHKDNLENDIKFIVGDDSNTLSNIYELWQKASSVAGDINTKLDMQMQAEETIANYKNDIAKAERKIADYKAMLQIPLEYQSGVKSFLFFVKDVASAVTNKVITMVNWFWSGSNHRDNVKRSDATANAATSLKSHFKSLLDSNDEENYNVIFQTYENPKIDNALKSQIKDIYLAAIDKSPTYLKSLQDAMVTFGKGKDWANFVSITFTLIHINPKEALYVEGIKTHIEEAFAVKNSIETDEDYYKRILEGIKLLVELYKSPEYLKNDGQIIALREFIKLKFERLVNRCDTYKQVGVKREVSTIDLKILATSEQLLSLALPVKEKYAADIYNILLNKVDSSLKELFANPDHLPTAVQFLYGVCPPVNGINAKTVWSQQLTDQQVYGAIAINAALSMTVMNYLPKNAQTRIPGFKQAMIDYFGREKADAILKSQTFDKSDNVQQNKLVNMVNKLDEVYIRELRWMNSFDLDDTTKENNVYDSLKTMMDTYLSDDQLQTFMKNLQNKLSREPATAAETYAIFEPAVKIFFTRIQFQANEYKTVNVFYYLDKLQEYKIKLDKDQLVSEQEKKTFDNHCLYIVKNGDAKQIVYVKELMSKQHKLEEKAARDGDETLLSRIASTVTFGFWTPKKAYISPPATPVQSSTPLVTPRGSITPPSKAAASFKSPAQLESPQSMTPIANSATPRSSTTLSDVPTPLAQKSAQWTTSASTSGTAQLIHLPGTIGSQAPHQPNLEIIKPILITLPENNGDILPAIGNGLCGYNSIALQIGLVAVQNKQNPNEDLNDMLMTVFTELRNSNSSKAAIGAKNFEEFCNKITNFMAEENGRKILQNHLAPLLFKLAHTNIDEEKAKFLEFAKQEMMAAFEVFSYRALNIGYEAAIKMLGTELDQGELREILGPNFYGIFSAQLQEAYETAKSASRATVPTVGQFTSAVSNAQLKIGEYFDSIANQYWARRNNNRWLGHYEINKLGEKLGFQAKIYQKNQEGGWRDTTTSLGQKNTKVVLDMARTGLHYDALLTERHRSLIALQSIRQRP